MKAKVLTLPWLGMLCAGLFSAVFITISLHLSRAMAAFALQRRGTLRRQCKGIFSEHSPAAAPWCRDLDLARKGSPMLV